jgi:large subunit ribosomal protein L22
MGYSYQLDKEDEKKTAKAFGKEIDISPKKANEVCYTIKGMNVDKAITYLENVTKMKAFVPMRRYNKNVGHRKG